MVLIDQIEYIYLSLIYKFIFIFLIDWLLYHFSRRCLGPPYSTTLPHGSNFTSAVWIPIFISSVFIRHENAWWWTVVKIFIIENASCLGKNKQYQVCDSSALVYTFVTLIQWFWFRCNNVFCPPCSLHATSVHCLNVALQ